MSDKFKLPYPWYFLGFFTVFPLFPLVSAMETYYSHHKEDEYVLSKKEKIITGALFTLLVVLGVAQSFMSE